MNTRLDLVIGNFKEFIHRIRTLNIDGDVEIEYTPYLYDYIDDDLDFNEEYYSGLCASFQRWLETTALDMVKTREVKSVTIIQNRMVFRHEDHHVQTVAIRLNNEKGCVTTTRETHQLL